MRSGAPNLGKFYPPRAADQPALARLLAPAGRKADAALLLARRALLGAAESLRRLWSGRLGGGAAGPGGRGSGGPGGGRFPFPVPEGYRSRAPADRSGAAESLVLDPELALLLSILPGLGHFFAQGPGRLPAALLGIFGVLALWAVFFMPVFWPALPFLVLFNFHVWAMTDAMRRARRACGLPDLRPWRAAGAALLAVSLLVMVYGGAVHLAGQAGAVTVVRRAGFEPMFRPGDRLVFLRAAAYGRGDIVYSSRSRSFERVAALAGDTVRVSRGKVYVNGAELPEAGLSRAIPVHRMEGASRRVPEGGLCVFFPVFTEGIFGDALLSFFIVGQDELAGRLRFRYWPAPEAFP